ncbi:sulfate/molybdate ABC transporter ATP-binding protein [uncultured Mitsuokella sp.]|uniref:sulfate/molybdate ABC transporter ATP-binding protein n=1 Tax=uncultured Mitsuokella sp. TaxID=453120 RepID=UPI00266BA07E|nr:ATP-binding cassette domain-containing protein [uncultured Mitsuokella sp.]
MELDVKIEKELRNFILRADFTLRDEVFALLGASGCGKSMTLKCIAGLERPDRGRIVLDGRVLFDSEQGIDLSPQERRVGYLFQNFALFPNMTIAENIRFVARGTRQQREARVRENLARFDLTELGNAYPMELSGGQQQRAAFARILASDAKILLLDEPFSALDHYLKWKLELELREVLKSYGGAAVLVSHDRGEVYRLASRAAVIDRGQMQPVRTRDELFEHPDTLAATLLTGCKNVSAARKTAEGIVEAADWQLSLHVSGKVSDRTAYVGLRAHFLEYREGKERPEENIFRMEVTDVIEDTFSYLVMIRRAGHQASCIRWELPKAEWRAIKAPVLSVYFPPEKIMLMES